MKELLPRYKLMASWAMRNRKLVGKREEKRAALMKNQTLQMEEMTSALAMLARCTLCADCLDACPLYDCELAGMLGAGNARQPGHSL